MKFNLKKWIWTIEKLKIIHLPQSKYDNNTDNLLVFYKIWKKYNEIQIRKKQNVLEQSKNIKIIHPPRNNTWTSVTVSK